MKKKLKILFLKLEIIYENHPPKRHIKHKKINFTPCNKSIIANKLLSTFLERFLRRIKSPLTRLEREIYRALIVSNWPKTPSLKPHNFLKNSHRKNIFSNLSSGQQYLLNDLKNSVRNG